MTQLLRCVVCIYGSSCADVLQDILEKGKLFVNQVARSTRTPRVSILLHGPPASGKTVLAASIAWASQFPFIKLISPDRMVGFSEAQKIQFITRTFTDSYKSPLSVIVVDNLERLLGKIMNGTGNHYTYLHLQIGRHSVVGFPILFCKLSLSSLLANRPRLVLLSAI